MNVSDLRIVNNDSKTSGTLFLGIFASQTYRSRSEGLGGMSGYHLLDVEDRHPNRDGLLRLRWISSREPLQLQAGASARIVLDRAGLREPPAGGYWLYALVYEWNSALPENGSRCFQAGWAFERQASFGAGADDHGNSLTSATRVALPSDTAGAIDPSSDEDFFRFEVAAAGEVTAETTGSLDTVGILYDASGDWLANNDDLAPGTNTNFRIRRTLAAGVYYLEVESYGTGTGSYTLHLRGGGDDHGDSRGTATRVALPSTTSGVINPGDDVDWFRFEAPARGELTAETTGSLDTVGTLYDASGGQLAANDDWQANNLNFRIVRTVAAGAYYVRVASYESRTGAYALRLRFEASGGGGDDGAPPQAGAAASHLRSLGDFNGDGKDDVLLRHEDGRWHYYPMDGRRVLPGSGAVGLTRNLAWRIAGIGDFDGDGRDDVLLRHEEGRWYFYPMNGRAVLAGRGAASLTPNLAWQVAGIGDFNDDGRDDVLLRHEEGRWHYYAMDGRRPLGGSGRASLTTNLVWSVAGVGDFDGDGRADVLLRHREGRWYLYPMNGRSILAGRGSVGLTTDLAWQVAGVADFDGDRRHDVLLRHEDGRWRYYPLNGRTVRSGSGEANLTANTTIAVAGIGDLNGDGRADVLLRRANGRWYYYPMNGRRAIAGRGDASMTADSAWTVAAPSAPGQTTTDGLRIATDARSPVQPLQTVTLTVRGGAAGAEYDVHMDLSGTGRFEAGDTIELAPVASAAGRLLLAAPLPETLAAGNAARRVAVRIRQRGGEAQSNTLTFTLGRPTVPASLAGHPTVMLDVLLKGAFEGLDDPLLAVEAGAVDPGRSARAAQALGLSTAYSDAQAQAVLRSLFGFSLTAASGAGGPPPPHPDAAEAPRRTAAAVRCEAWATDALCDGYREVANCVGDAMDSFRVGNDGDEDIRRCARVAVEAAAEPWIDYAAEVRRNVRSIGSFLRGAASRVARALGVGKPPAQQIFDRNAVMRVVDLGKALRATPGVAGDALRQTWSAMRDAKEALTEDNPDLVAEAEQEAAADSLDDDERDAFFALVGEADYHQSDAEAIAELEDVYTGEADVVETLGSAGGGGSSRGASCGANYEEFPVDERTSTCVWSSLVEWNCYAGSRPVTHPNLGGANTCLYYSLDYFQADGTCRENYAKVRFQGRETCRWAELGANRAEWYTLEKEHGVGSPQTPVETDSDDPDEVQTTCQDYTEEYIEGFVSVCRGYGRVTCCLTCANMQCTDTPADCRSHYTNEYGDNCTGYVVSETGLSESLSIARWRLPSAALHRDEPASTRRTARADVGTSTQPRD